MKPYRTDFPKLVDHKYLCYTGMETDLIFNRGIDLPGFASFPLLRSEQGRELLKSYYHQLIGIGEEYGLGVFLDSPTWVANRDRAALLGYAPDELSELNTEAIALIAEMRDVAPGVPTILSAQVGPRGDGYAVSGQMSAEEADAYHREQIETLADAGAELISAFTLTYPEEAVGIVRAADRCNIPVIIAFTVETDGALPSGDSLASAIDQVDTRTQGGPNCYLVNCAHPDHFRDKLTDEVWPGRIRGVVVNASRSSHAELDEAETLDDGNPDELGLLVGNLARGFPHFTIFGGCCGTDVRHMRRIAEQLSCHIN